MYLKKISFLTCSFLLFVSTGALAQSSSGEVPVSVSSETEILIDLVLKDDIQAVDNVARKVKDAKTAIQNARDKLAEAEEKTDITAEERAEAELSVDKGEKSLVRAKSDLEASRAELNKEKETVRRQVDDLTEEQVADLNRALHNASSNNLDFSLSSADLQTVIDGQYNRQQINMFTQALETEAKFMGKSARFEEKAEIRSNDNLMEQSGKMETIASVQRDRVEGKIDRFKDQGNSDGQEGLAARQMLREIARASLAESARASAKDAVKNDVKNSVREDARDITRQIMKEEGRNAVKGEGSIKSLTDPEL